MLDKLIISTSLTWGPYIIRSATSRSKKLTMTRIIIYKQPEVPHFIISGSVK